MARIEFLADRPPAAPSAGAVIDLVVERLDPAGAVRRLGGLVAAFDSGTASHHERVGRYGMRLAAAVDGSLLRDSVLFGLLLHDVGKLVVPGRVIRKPGPLSDGEWRCVRRHPTVGAELLAGIPGLEAAAPLVRAHHERWDGRGYPDGLRGTRIPLAARIFSIVDAFDAMTSNRPYRFAMAAADALDEIEREAGKQFDPDLVRIFASVFGEDMVLAA